MVNSILIVEDEVFLAETIGARLEFLGYEVLSVEKGEAALEILAEGPFDLILMDWMLPGIDGLETTRRIRKDPKRGLIPIIFMSARARAQDAEEARSAGATDYVAKPFESEDLVRAIQKWLP